MLDLGKEFHCNEPFPHLVVDDFFVADFLQALIHSFPPFDVKKATNELGEVGRKAVHENVREIGQVYQQLDDLVKSDEFLRFVSGITMIPDLIYDPEYIGGGTHENLEGQELDPHVDFNYHTSRKWHRRLNLLVYLNPEWGVDWGGAIELHSNPWKPDENRVKTILPVANRMVVFETSERSWHGFKQIRFPEERKHLSRKSIALYFYTQERPQEEITAEHGTFYVHRALPEEIREGHTLTESDVQNLQLLLTKRDQWIQFLYSREIKFSTDAGNKNEELRLHKEELKKLQSSWRYRLAKILSWPSQKIPGK